MWSGLLVEMGSCKFGSVCLFILVLLLLPLLWKGLDLCCLLKGHNLGPLDDVCLCKCDLHLPHIDLLQS